ncbi:MAG: hypothetical protein K0R18_2382 [Bacillales bacterium]|jgi:hypothetical protein|nr:hypothetical protein [Bacillales bacterium]
MRDELKNWSKMLLDFRLPRWEELPDFELYSDQVVQLVNGYLHLVEEVEKDVLTASMINNYVKQKMIPKPDKKKYQKVHLAYLIAIGLLKKVLTITQVNDGIRYQSEVSGLIGAYNLFCIEVERALNNVATQIHERDNERKLDVTSDGQALYFAANAFAHKLIANKIVNLNNQRMEKSNE